MDNGRIEELFEGLGPVTIRRLFGGKGIYHRGVIIAIVLQGELMLKADAISAPDFVSAGARQWTYAGKGREVAMPYWTTPVRIPVKPVRDRGQTGNFCRIPK
jgi:DNA transformation protein